MERNNFKKLKAISKLVFSVSCYNVECLLPFHVITKLMRVLHYQSYCKFQEQNDLFKTEH